MLLPCPPGKRKTPGRLTGCLRCWQRPIFPGGFPPSIFGTGELNFRVRDGNGWDLTVINTGSYFFLCGKKKVSKKETTFSFFTLFFPEKKAVCVTPVGLNTWFFAERKRKQKRNGISFSTLFFPKKKLYAQPPWGRGTNIINEPLSRWIERGDPCGNRTRVTGVRGRCLNRLTNGPDGAPSGTRTRDPLIKSQLLYQLS